MMGSDLKAFATSDPVSSVSNTLECSPKILLVFMMGQFKSRKKIVMVGTYWLALITSSILLFSLM